MLRVCGWQDDGQDGVRETQPFKGVENYFTGALLYKENGKLMKKLLSDDIDSDNEADSKSGDDSVVSFDE